jgi:hypothetical protein
MQTIKPRQMQILKGSKERREDFNEFAYSKGSHYAEYSLDRQANFLEGCLRTANNNDYSGSQDEFNRLRKEAIEYVLTHYPPQFVPERNRELVEIEKDRIRWNVEALSILSSDTYQWYLFRRWLDYAVVRHAKPDNTYHNTDIQFKECLRGALEVFQEEINKGIN